MNRKIVLFFLNNNSIIFFFFKAQQTPQASLWDEKYILQMLFLFNIMGNLKSIICSDSCQHFKRLRYDMVKTNFAKIQVIQMLNFNSIKSCIQCCSTSILTTCVSITYRTKTLKNFSFTFCGLLHLWLIARVILMTK